MASTSSTNNPLSAQQAQVLFDILTNHQLSNEISRFRYPDGIEGYGAPFDSGLSSGAQKGTSSSPLLQSLVSKFVLGLPGLRDVDSKFWKERAGVLVKKLGGAELSESYDKGRIGSRRALAIASAVLLELPTRGVLGGLPDAPGQGQSKEAASQEEEYDPQDADDVLRAWDRFMYEVVYGDRIDKVFEKVKQTDKLEEHEPLHRAAHEYIIVNLATFLHYVMVHSPDGPYIVRLVENVHKLVPYTVMRQTLKVGNAATMMQGMVRLLLTKMSVGAITNWLGLSKDAEDGMNLLQQIVSTVISWDIADLKKQSSKLEGSKNAPSKKCFKAITTYVQKSREVHDSARAKSEKESKSLVAVILDEAEGVTSEGLDDIQHGVAVEYLGLQLSIRDREQLSKIFCQLRPDVLTQGIKDVVAAYDPIIRGIHSAADLSAGLWDFECFLTDFIKLSKPASASKSGKSGKGSGTATPNQSGQGQLPPVEEYVALLRKHMPGAHRFSHQIAKNGPQVTKMYNAYVKEAAANFRRKQGIESEKSSGTGSAAAGSMTPHLQKLVADLPEDRRKAVLDKLDEYAAHTMALNSSSRDRLRAVLENSNAPAFRRSNTSGSSTTNKDSKSSRPSSSHSNASQSSLSSFSATSHKRGSMFGPGLYLSRLQQSIDETAITPKTAKGPVRHGADRSVREAEIVDSMDGSRNVTSIVSVDELGIKAPDVAVVVEALGDDFRDLVRGLLADGAKQ